jgi:hypothetical protein
MFSEGKTEKNFIETFLDVRATLKKHGGMLTQRAKRLFMTALFGSIIFVVNVFLPAPINYLFIVVQAVLLALSGLFINHVGATSAGAVGGLLTALLSPGLGPFTFLFAFLFGVLVDVFLFVFRISASPVGVNRNRLMAAMAVSTLLIGVLSYLAFSQGYSNFGLFVIQRSMMFDALVLFMGPVTGAVAGYAAAYLWNKYLRSINF